MLTLFHLAIRQTVASPFSAIASVGFALAILCFSCACSKDDSTASPAQASVPNLDPAKLLERPHPRVLGFAPNFRLTNQQGDTFPSSKLEGKPWVVNFMFTRCPSTCPRQTALLSLFQSRAEGRCHIVSITVDPEHDTANVLKSYARGAGADPERWTFLTGSKDEIHNTISREGFKLAVDTDGNEPHEIGHSPMFILVDAYQRVRSLIDSQSPDAINALMTDLAALEAETLPVPKDVMAPTWMEQRAEDQLATASSIAAFHDFTFTDQCEESGIRFMHKIVDESGKRFKGVHYDHGSGLAVADVDGDGLLDLYFVNQVGSNGLWRNLGDGKFEDITERAGVFVSDRIGVSASFADIDNDGDPDLYVTALRKGNVLFENLGGGRFRNVTAGSGLGHKGHSSSAVFFDYDRDGLVDVYVTNVGQYTTEETTPVTMEGIRGEAQTGETYHVGFSDAFGGHLKAEREEASRLYRNLGNRKFEDVSEALGIVDKGWTGDAAAVDLNEDGWTDLYLLSMQGNDSVYFNQQGKTFAKAPDTLFPKTPWGSMGIKAFDYENDGDLDLYLTDMHSDMSEHIGPEKEKAKAEMQWTPSFLLTEDSSIFGNAFFRNDGNGKFEEISDTIGAENYWPWGLSVGDLNADGFDDVFVTASMNFPLRYGVNSLLLNDRGQGFKDAEFILGVEPRASGAAVPWFELELAGRDKGAPVLDVLKGEGYDPATLPERVVVWGAKGSRSSAIIDVDDDGDLDIITNEMNHRPMVLLSNLSERKANLAYLKVILEGTTSNRSALGAIVRVTAGDETWMKLNDGQSGYLSHSVTPLYFGLNGKKQVERIEITWPRGTNQVLEGPIDANQTLSVKESGQNEATQASINSPSSTTVAEASGPIEVNPGDCIQGALETAAKDPQRKHVLVNAGTYRPKHPGQAMIWFNKRHEGITLEANGEVILTAANPELADKNAPSFPAVVNHVVYFGDGVSQKTVLRGFTITGANGYLATDDDSESIQPDIAADNLEKAKFFYTDGGGIKVYGRSYPTIEKVKVIDNFSSPCGAGLSVEHRGHTDGSRRQSVIIRDCIFENNRCPVSGAAVDLLHGSSAEITNCLFIGNLSNGPMDERAQNPGKWKPQHGSGALTIFPDSHVILRRCTFTGNRNAVDDSNHGNVYEDSIFWQNTASGGWPSGGRYELDIASGVGVDGCHIGGAIEDLKNTIDRDNNVLDCPDPQFDSNYVPQAAGFEDVGYRPPAD